MITLSQAVKCEEWMEHQVDPFIVYYPPLGRFVRCNTYRANGGWIVIQVNILYRYSLPSVLLRRLAVFFLCMPVFSLFLLFSVS